MTHPTLFERGAPGRCGIDLPDCDVPDIALPDSGLRHDNGLPELSQLEVVRHYTALAQRNFGVDSGFYPLGSCTMKYNPRLGESLARLSSVKRRLLALIRGARRLRYGKKGSEEGPVLEATFVTNAQNFIVLRPAPSNPSDVAVGQTLDFAVDGEDGQTAATFEARVYHLSPIKGDPHPCLTVHVPELLLR